MFVGSLVEGFQYMADYQYTPDYQYTCVLIAVPDESVTVEVYLIVESFACDTDLAETMGLVLETVAIVFACNWNLQSVLIWDLGLIFALDLMLELERLAKLQSWNHRLHSHDGQVCLLNQG